MILYHFIIYNLKKEIYFFPKTAFLQKKIPNTYLNYINSLLVTNNYYCWN